jgi:hypothetical protein
MMSLPRVAAALAPLLLLSIPALAQQQQQSLPDVNVTAQAPIKNINPFNPFSGNTRVEEDKWPVIQCQAARIDLGTGARCQTGTQIENFMTMSASGRCDIARQLAMVKNGRYEAEADVMIFDPYKVTAAGHQLKNCTVWTGYTNMPDDFRDMNQMTRRQFHEGRAAKHDFLHRWRTQLRGGRAAGAALARRLCLGGACQHLPRRGGVGSERRYRRGVRDAAAAAVRPGGQSARRADTITTSV